MRFNQHSTIELLSRIIGEDHARTYQGSLKPFFEPSGDEIHHDTLLLVRELVRRWFDEEMRHGCVVTNPHQVRAYLHLDLAKEEQEVFIALFVDNANRVIAHQRMFFGTFDEAFVCPREVVKAALRHNATGVIMAHNHPCGSNMQSLADEHLTKRTKDAFALVRIRLLDHIVIAGKDIISLASKGLI